MAEKIRREGHCPRCGGFYRGVPALSRADFKTQICPDCGVREALTALGLDEKEQEEIIAIIHRSRGEKV